MYTYLIMAMVLSFALAFFIGSVKNLKKSNLLLVLVSIVLLAVFIGFASNALLATVAQYMLMGSGPVPTVVIALLFLFVMVAFCAQSSKGKPLLQKLYSNIVPTLFIGGYQLWFMTSFFPGCFTRRRIPAGICRLPDLNAGEWVSIIAFLILAITLILVSAFRWYYIKRDTDTA